MWTEIDESTRPYVEESTRTRPHIDRIDPAIDKSTWRDDVDDLIFGRWHPHLQPALNHNNNNLPQTRTTNTDNIDEDNKGMNDDYTNNNHDFASTQLLGENG